MPLTRAEFELRKRLPTLEQLLLFDAALAVGWTSVKELAELAEVAYDLAQAELKALERDGLLLVEYRDGAVRYREGPQCR